MIGVILLFILVSSAGVAYLSTRPSPSSGVTEYGVCLHLYQFDNYTATQLSQLNSKWVRIDWIPNQMDNFVNVMNANGIKILAILDHNTMNNTVPPNLNFTLPQWTEVVRSVMATDAAKKVDAWEIWNEPNAGQFQFGYMNGSSQNYTDMLKSAYQTIKSVSNASVVAAGLSPDYPNSTTPNWKIWLTDFNATSPQSFFDFQGVHLYDDVTINSEIIRQTNEIMGKGVWITEIGRKSAPSPNYSSQDQSSYLSTNFQMLASLNYPVFWYQLKDETNVSEKESNFGLFDYQNNPKDSSIIFTNIASSP